MNRITYYTKFFKAFFYKVLRRLGLIAHNKTMDDQNLDRIAPFDEYPSCELCGSLVNKEVLIASDGSRIVTCETCALWFTSPRINENAWIDWLKETSERSKIFTENRLEHGVALPSNIKYQYPNWRHKISERNNAILELIKKWADQPIQQLHDVGCGVGFMLQDAQNQGIKTTGNELNSYAYNIMKDLLGLSVYNEVFSKLTFPEESLDAVIMNDFIEHTYHPMEDLQTSYRFLKKGGILFIGTFHVDCSLFKKHGASWNMLFWNHVFHFSTETLKNIIKKAGFEVIAVHTSYNDSIIKVIARKK